MDFYHSRFFAKKLEIEIFIFGSVQYGFPYFDKTSQIALIY